MARTVAAPPVVVCVNQTEPKWFRRMPSPSAGPRRSFARPTLKSCPIRWGSVMDANTRSTHGAGVGEEGGGVVGEGEVVGFGPADGAVHAAAVRVMAARSAPRRGRGRRAGSGAGAGRR